MSSLWKASDGELTKDMSRRWRYVAERRKDREEAAYEYSFTQGKRNTLIELLDREVMSKEDAKKGATDHMWNGDWEQATYKTWGLISDVSVDVTKALATTTAVLALTRSPFLARRVTAATFAYQAGGTTAGEYAAIPGITGDEAMGMGYKSAAIEFAVTEPSLVWNLILLRGSRPKGWRGATEGVLRMWQRFPRPRRSNVKKNVRAPRSFSSWLETKLTVACGVKQVYDPTRPGEVLQSSSVTRLLVVLGGGRCFA